jgi:streptogramin lyase
LGYCGNRKILKTSFWIVRLRVLVILALITVQISFAFQSATPPNFIVVRAEAVRSHLQAYRIVQYPLPNGSLQPWGISVDLSGRVWFVEEQSNQIGMFDPKTKSFSEFNVTTPNALLEEVSIDGSGNPWFTELNGERLGELNISTNTIHEFPIPNGPGNLPCGPIGVIAAKSSIWITCEFSDQFDQFFSGNSSFSTYNLPIFYSAPLDIVFDSTGNFWFTAADSNMIGYVTTSELKAGTSDGIHEFAPRNPTYLVTITNPEPPPGVPQYGNPNQTIASSLRTPSQLALGSNGNLWITEHVSSSFDEYNTNSGILDKYWTSQTHNPNFTNSLPNGIAIDRSGVVWIAEHYGNKIAEFDPGSRTMIEYPIPCCGSQLAGSLYLALGGNSTVWFTEFYGNRVGELLPVNSSSLSVSLDNLSVSTNGNNGNVTVPILVSTSNGDRNQNVTFDISGLTDSGQFTNASASFSPSRVSLGPNGSGRDELVIKTRGLSPGDYYLTVSASSSLSGDIYSAILSMAVTEPPNFTSLLTDALLVGVVLAVITVGSLALIMTWRQKRSMRKH